MQFGNVTSNFFVFAELIIVERSRQLYATVCFSYGGGRTLQLFVNSIKFVDEK